MLYRRPNSSKWWTRFTTPDGQEVRRSTGTEDKKAAEEYEARLKQEQWRIARMGEKPRHTWQDAVLQWLAETEHKASRVDDLMHLRWLDPYLKDKQLEEIDKAVIESLKRQRQTEKTARRPGGVTPATVNRMLALIRSILRRAEREWEWLDKAPAVRLLAEPKRRVRWLTHEEAARLVAELPEHLADMARFSLATGLREANVTGLRWDQIDLVRRVAWLHADQMKAGQALGVPLNRDAVLVLRRWLGKHPIRVFCFKGEPIAHANTAAWHKALGRASITDFRWHDLRHTWASWHVQAGTPLHILQELGGWATPGMVQRYAHLAPDQLADHASRIAAPLALVTEDEEYMREDACTFSGTPEKKKAPLGA